MDSSDGYRRIRKDRRARRPGTPEACVSAYVTLRKALGFRTADPAGTLRRFLGFMRSRNIASFDQIDRKTAMAWLHSGPQQESSIGNRLSAMRGLYSYLFSLGVVKGNVWDSFTSPKPKRFVPYIFSLEELKAVLGRVRSKIGLVGYHMFHVHAAHHVMLHTLYACGLRAGEVCRLSIGDVDFNRCLFVVRRTKFGKTRLVPFNSRTRELIVEYLDRFRRRADGKPSDAPLFLNLRQHPFGPEGLSKHLIRACAAVGVYRPKRIEGNTVYGGTNLHALRHSFAVHRLLMWYEEGADVNAKLPLLATYMGHAHYSYTQRYLTVLPRFIDIAGKLFAGKFEGPLKDLE